MSYRQHAESFFYDHPIILGIIIAVIISTFVFTYMHTLSLDSKKIPIIERTVDSNVLVNGYTECVFIIDEQKHISNEFPCKNKTGETVKTKLMPNSKKILIIEAKP